MRVPASMSDKELLMGAGTALQELFFDENPVGYLISQLLFRILIQYLENVLKFGAINKKKVPLEISFVQKQIFTDFSEVVTLSEQQERVLSFLKNDPTHINDPKMLNLYKRTSLQNIVKELEQRLLVSRNTKKPGVPQIYSATLLGEIILNNAIVE